MADLPWAMAWLTQAAPTVALAIVAMPLVILVVVLFVPSETPARRLVRIIQAFFRPH